MDTKITCHTGGAIGTDMCFEKLCLQEDINVIAYSFRGHVTSSTCRKILTEDELIAVNDKVEEIGKIIKRYPPFKRPGIIKYIQRNIYQAETSQVVFGFGEMDWNILVPIGGTAWATFAGVLKGIDVFFYDQKKKMWFKYQDKTKNRWIDIADIPEYIFDYTDFTGIGTRKIDIAAVDIIRDLVKRYKNNSKQKE